MTDSSEEVFDLVFSYPAQLFFNWDVKALCDWIHSYDTTINNWAQAAAP
jgi:hypothetical protein